jgi:hypothetical protein
VLKFPCVKHMFSQSLVFCVMFCRSLFVLLAIVLYVLLYLLLLITSLVSSDYFFGIFWLPLWYLLITSLVSSDYLFGIFWLSLWYLLITSLVSSDYFFGIFWLPLWYLQTFVFHKHDLLYVAYEAHIHQAWLFMKFLIFQEKNTACALCKYILLVRVICEKYRLRGEANILTVLETCIFRK